MYLNIITPCSRPENLISIGLSINIPLDNFRWIVVFDADEVPDLSVSKSQFKNTEFYAHRNINGCSGNSQRNFALDLVEDGYVYFQDDDTTMHQDLWENIKDLSQDFIHFNQSFADGNLRLNTAKVGVGYIDSHNFIVSMKLIGDLRWQIDKYEADGIFAEKCIEKKPSYISINKTLSIYNSLR